MEPEGTLSRAVRAVFEAQLSKLNGTPDTGKASLYRETAEIYWSIRGPSEDLSFRIGEIVDQGVSLTDAYNALLTLDEQGHLHTIPGYNGTPQRYVLTRDGLRAAQKYVGQPQPNV